MTKLQEELIADNLHAFKANFGDVRIEQDMGFYVYSPANAETHVHYCYNIYYLDGWLYGCVQGANKIVKEVTDV